MRVRVRVGATVGVGVARGGRVLHVALQAVVPPRALKGGAGGGGELPGPMPG